MPRRLPSLGADTSTFVVSGSTVSHPVHGAVPGWDTHVVRSGWTVVDERREAGREYGATACDFGPHRDVGDVVVLDPAGDPSRAGNPAMSTAASLRTGVECQRLPFVDGGQLVS